MKKLLGILVLGLLCSVNSFAATEGCSSPEDYNSDYELVDERYNKTKYRNNVKFIKFIIKSKSDKRMIYTATFKTKDNKVFSRLIINVPPFAAKEGYMDLRGKNMDMIWNEEVLPYMRCEFVSRKVKKKKKKSWSQKTLDKIKGN